jgi:release factor glutamine methyltransferase
MTSWSDILTAAAARLREAGVEGPARDARVLLGDVLGLDGGGVLAIGDQPAGAEQAAAFEAMIMRRAAGEPVSRIRGWREFYGRRFRVSPAVLDPRPDTETLVGAALERLPAGGRVLDLGTGSGCILITILVERAGASGAGVDLSPDALAIAQGNAGDLEVMDRALFVEGSWAAALPLGPFDMVVSNPPYIPTGDIAGLDRDVREHDPMLALDGGADGLAPYREICVLAASLLRPGGWLLLEVGTGQAEDVLELASDAGLAAIGALEDLNGIRRVVVAQAAAGPSA